jgi:hypothetical protein
MAAEKGILVSALYRIAQLQGNPVAYLTDILQGRYSRVLAGNGRVIISSSTGGSAASWSIPAGMDDLQIMELAELALRLFDTGVNAPYDPNNPDNTAPAINPLRNSDQIVTYGAYGTISR